MRGPAPPVPLMKILWHSNWNVPTGYGQQTELWVPRIASLGHEVAISAFHGLNGGMTTWRGHTVYPGGQDPYGSDVLARHARHFGADLVITLMDVWCLEPELVKGLPLAHWMPVDCDNGGGLQQRPIGLGDQVMLKATGGVPIAMSRFGEQQLRAAGHEPLYVPHGVDCTVFRPPRDRAADRGAMGIGDRFVIGVNAANSSKHDRKAWVVQLAAFARLHRKHPDTLLFAQAHRKSKHGLNLAGIARDLGIDRAVHWVDEYMLTSGLITPGMLAATVGAWDLASAASKAEGFGIPIAEAEACSVPTVVTDFSAMPEVSSGWKVPGEPEWTPVHAAWWRRPSIADVARIYEKAYQRGPAYQAKASKAREHAMTYDADRVLAEHWKPVLEVLAGRACRT